MNQTVHRLFRALMMMFMLALLPLGTHARQFVVDQPLSDSVRCEEVVRNDTAWTTKGGNAHIYLRNGEIIDSCGSIYKSSIVFRHGSKYYYLSRHSLLWSRTNADYLSDPMTFKQHLVHSSVGRFYSTLWACWTVIGLFAVVVIMLICCRFRSLAMAQALQVVMPFSLFAVAVIEAFSAWCSVSYLSFSLLAFRLSVSECMTGCCSLMTDLTVLAPYTSSRQPSAWCCSCL